MALTDQQLAVIQGLASGLVTQKKLAKDLGVGESTITHWLKDQDFQTELASERHKIRDQRFDQAFSTLSEALTLAATQLVTTLKDPTLTRSDRLKAIDLTLKHAISMRESDLGSKLADLEDVVARLKEALGDE